MSRALHSTELHKVAVLCVRANRELLVFEHTGGGVQVPAGTVEAGEEITAAAVRELAEETGMVVGSVTHLFSIEEQGDPDERVVAADVPLLAEPRESAVLVKPSLWRTWVRVRECVEEFTRVAVESWDLDRNPPVRIESIDGFVLSAALLRSQQRHISTQSRRLQRPPAHGKFWQRGCIHFVADGSHWIGPGCSRCIKLGSIGLGNPKIYKAHFDDRGQPPCILTIGDSLRIDFGTTGTLSAL